MERNHYAAGGGLLAAALLFGGYDGLPSDIDEAQQRMTTNAESVIDRIVEVSSDGELTVDPLTGVFYDDPETGEMDDEAGDDANLSFSAINEAVDGTLLDPETYAPDVEGDATAPSSGVISDAGDSQNWGSAGEQENDDLTERTADSNLSDDEKAAFDRLANVDDPETLDSHQDDSVTESGSNYSTVDDSGSSWSSGSTSTSTSSSTEEEEKDPFAHLYDDGVTGTSSGLVE